MTLQMITLEIRVAKLPTLDPAYLDFDALIELCIERSKKAWQEHLNSSEENILPCFVTGTSLVKGESTQILLPFSSREEKWAMFAAVTQIFAEQKVDFYVVHSETTARTQDKDGKLSEPRDTLAIVGAHKDGRVRFHSLAFREERGIKRVYQEPDTDTGGETEGELTKFLSKQPAKQHRPAGAGKIGSWL